MWTWNNEEIFNFILPYIKESKLEKKDGDSPNFRLNAAAIQGIFSNFFPPHVVCRTHFNIIESSLITVMIWFECYTEIGTS